MDKLNAKVISSRDDSYTAAQIVGVTGLNTSTNRMKVAHVTDSNELLVSSSGAGPDVGHEVKIFGSEDGTPSGTQKQCHVDGSGNLLTSIVSTVNVRPADTLNSGTQADPADSVAVGLRARTDKADAATETFLLCDSQGHLQVDMLNQNQEAQLAAFTDINNVGSVKRLLCDSDGHLQVDIVSGGGGGGGDATAANQTTMISSLSNIDTATSSIQSNVATSSLQTAGNASLTSLDGKVTACNTGAVVISSNSDTTKATSTNQGTIIANQTNGTQVTSIAQGGNTAAVNSSNQLRVEAEPAHNAITSNTLNIGAGLADNIGQDTSDVYFDSAGYSKVVVIVQSHTDSFGNSQASIEWQNAVTSGAAPRQLESNPWVMNGDSSGFPDFTSRFLSTAVLPSGSTTSREQTAFFYNELPARYFRVNLKNGSGSAHDYSANVYFTS